MHLALTLTRGLRDATTTRHARHRRGRQGVSAPRGGQGGTEWGSLTPPLFAITARVRYERRQKTPPRLRHRSRQAASLQQFAAHSCTRHLSRCRCVSPVVRGEMGMNYCRGFIPGLFSLTTCRPAKRDSHIDVKARRTRPRPGHVQARHDGLGSGPVTPPRRRPRAIGDRGQ